jgi:hypothetical protein
MTNDQPLSTNCPQCGMPIADGAKPTVRDGQLYCCEECANGVACTCPKHRH